MGDRISISFTDGDDESVALFSHWGGADFLKSAEKFVEELNNKVKYDAYDPATRREPQWMMVDFILWLGMTQDGEANLHSSSPFLYLGKDGNDGDNSDNGHWVVDVKTGKAKEKPLND